MMQAESIDMNAYEKNAGTDQELEDMQGDGLVELFRDVVENYIIEANNNDKPWTKEISASVINSACIKLCKMLDDPLPSNIKPSIEEIFSCIDHYLSVRVWTRGIIQDELEYLHLMLFISGVANDSLLIMHRGYDYFTQLPICQFMMDDYQIFRVWKNVFIKRRMSSKKLCSFGLGHIYLMSIHAGIYLHDRIRFLQKKDGKYESEDYDEPVDNLIFVLLFSVMMLFFYEYSFTIGAIISGCIGIVCLVLAIRILWSYADDIMLAFRRFSPFSRIWCLLFIAIVPWLLAWLNVPGGIAFIIVVCASHLYFAVEVGGNKLFRKNVAKKKFAPREIIQMFVEFSRGS